MTTRFRLDILTRHWGLRLAPTRPEQVTRPEVQDEFTGNDQTLIDYQYISVTDQPVEFADPLCARRRLWRSSYEPHWYRQPSDCLSPPFSPNYMASLLGALLNLLRILRSSAKDHIKRLLRSPWATLLAYLSCKLSECRSWLSNPGAHRKPKPVDPSFPGGRGGTCSVSCSSSVRARGHAARVAASTVPASANATNRPHRELEGAERGQVGPGTALPLSSIQDTLPAPSSGEVGEIRWPGIGENGPNHDRSRKPSFRSAGDRPSISRTSSRASSQTQNDRASRDPSPRATSRQFRPDPGAQSRRRSSKSPSPQPSLNTAQPYHSSPILTSSNIHPHADGMSFTASLPNLMGSRPPFSTSQGQLGPPVSPRRQGKTSIGLNIQDTSTDSLPTIPINAQEITEGPMAMDTSPHWPLHTLPSDRAETASQNSYTPSSATSDLLLPEGRFLRLFNSDQVPRYTKNATISRELKLRIIAPLTTTFLHFSDPNAPDQPSPMRDCSPWIPATHPDGALYFYDPGRRLFTDTDMHDHTLRVEMEDFYSYLKKLERVGHLTIPSKNYDMVLDLMPDGYNQMRWSYYYSCHDTRCLFWLEEYDTIHMTSLDGVESPAHLKHQLESLYWNHWDLFPVVFEGRCLPLSVYDELMGMLAHGCIDVMSSSVSTLPLSDDQMQKMIKLIQLAKEARCGMGSVIGVNIAGGVDSISNVSAVSNAGGIEHYTAATSRLLMYFAQWRFLDFHGQRHARLISGQTVYDTTKRKRSALVTLLSPLLFFAPEVHLTEMDKLGMDGFIIEWTWKSFITKILSEWNDLILWSTVTLALDVSFLSIPGVVQNSAPNGTLSIPRQMTILSLLVSIGSILIGLVLVRHNRTKQDAKPEELGDYFSHNADGYFGLDLMAIIFSLPWALLIWSMLLFLAAAILYSWSVSNFWSRIVVASILVFVFSLLLGCMWTTWDSSGGLGVWLHGLRLLISHALQVSHAMIARLRDGIMSFRNCFYTVTTDNGSERELAGQRDNVISGTV